MGRNVEPPISLPINHKYCLGCQNVIEERVIPKWGNYYDHEGEEGGICGPVIFRTEIEKLITTV